MVRKLKNIELNRLSISEFKETDKKPIVLILDNIRSLHNVGSIFRTADAFLVSKIYLCGITGTPPNNEIQKSALGAQESVDWEYNPSTLEVISNLKSLGYLIVSLEQTDKSVSLEEFNMLNTKKIALIFGNEVEGVSIDAINLSDVILEIEQEGTKHSLNVAVSAGITLYEVAKKIPTSN